MEHILKFNIPEETEQLLDCMNGSDYKYIIQNLDNWLKYQSKANDAPVDIFNEVRQQLGKLLEENNLTIY